MKPENKRTTGGRFAKGRSGHPAGRPKGVPNKITLEVKQFCQGVLASPAYQRRFRAAFIRRQVEPAIEAMVWHYAYGKPVATLNVSADFDPVAYLAAKSSNL